MKVSTQALLNGRVLNHGRNEETIRNEYNGHEPSPIVSLGVQEVHVPVWPGRIGIMAYGASTAKYVLIVR